MKQIRRSKIIHGLELSLTISIVVSVILLVRTMDLKELGQMLQIKPRFLILSGVLLFLIWLVQGIKMKILVTALDENISVIHGIKNYLAGAFVSNVTPFASGGGPVQAYFLHQQGMSFGKASSIIIVQWVLRHIFFGLLGPIFFIFYRDLIDPGKLPQGVFRVAVGSSIGITVALLFLVWKPHLIPRIASNLVKIPGIRNIMDRKDYRKRFNQLIDWAYNEIDVFHQCLWTLASKKKMALFLSVIFTALFWLFFFMIPPVILMGLGAEPHFIRAFVMQTIMYLILPFIPTPGASGAAELGFVAFFEPFVPFQLLGILMISWRFLTFYMMILAGSVMTLRLLKK